MQKISKRKRFLLTSVLLALGFVGLQYIEGTSKYWGIGLLGFFTVVLFIICLWEGLGRNATLLTLILPLFFTLSIGLFWFLLPSNLFTRLPINILYALGIYILCTTMNIYTVSAIRTIALLRAARSVGFVLTLFTMFLAFDSVLSMRLSPLIYMGLISSISLPLFLQGFWAMTLSKKSLKDEFFLSLISSLVVIETAASIYFWPVSVVVGSLMLILVSYVLLGLGQAKLESRLFKQTVRDYLIVAMLVFAVIVFSTNWSA